MSNKGRVKNGFGPRHKLGDERKVGLGWLRDNPDYRDSSIATIAPKILDGGDREKAHNRAVKSIRAKMGKKLPALVDNWEFCSPIEDQGDLGSCTAQAAVGMVEYMERKASDKYVNASRLFLYKVTRNLLDWTGDTGAYPRTTMKAMTIFGVPPEKWWPYDIDTFDEEPDAFLYSYAQNYKSIEYLRLDPPDLKREDVLKSVKSALVCGYAAMFGFTTYRSLDDEPDIPFPGKHDKADGGHAVLAVGYDDNRKNRGTRDRGALIIRNSWGEYWGLEGYGYLPYKYVKKGLAGDFWTCLKMDWIDTGKFD